ncbi:MAG: DUF3488 domain-containing transglutaminase family protein [Betaproteobacteria bacterium]|nr:DUF3488 domain-containing transglutaminase family protein [Betaproteobacteria bacterium]
MAANGDIGFRNTAWLIGALAMMAAPHAEHLPVWESLLCVMLVLWRLHIAHRNLSLPPRWPIILIALGTAVGVALSYGILFGREPGVALLIALVALKLMEMRTLRDAMLLVYLGYFGVLTNFFYSQSILIAIYMLATVIVTTAAMLGLNQMAGELPVRARFRFAATLLAQSVPLMLVLFVFFPRIQGPLWGLPQDAHAGLSGLTDTMTPGSISQLTLSDAVAFRVTFATPMPRPSQMYWRGPVLWNYDGRTWTQGRPTRFKAPGFQPEGEAVRYTVTLEPHNRHWLFVLDLPAELSARSRVTNDFQAIAYLPVRERMRYEAASHLQYRSGLAEAPSELQRALQLPPEFNPRGRALAQSWRLRGGSDEAVIAAALAHFREQPFVYTLTPPQLGEHAMDDFLFTVRRGFCEHYASAFVFLMRAAGIPSRVVLGYLGGEVNPVGNYLIVRQAEAHAWAEVWLAERGWVRVDPTAAVSPARIESGVAAAVPAGDPLPALARVDYRWIKQLRLRLDAVANNWNQWVLGYTPERQTRFLTRAGLNAPDWKSMTAALTIGTGALLLAFVAWTLWRLRPAVQGAVQAAYLRFCSKLARRGLPRGQAEGPRDYATRVSRARPELAQVVDAVIQLYIQLRYGTLRDEAAVAQLKRLVAAFKA